MSEVKRWTFTDECGYHNDFEYCDPDDVAELEAERDRLLRNAPAVMGWVSANVKDNGWADIDKAMQMLEEKS